MPRMTSSEFANYNARRAPAVDLPRPDAKRKPPQGSESDLHDKIMAFCKEKRYYFIHSRMDRATTQQKGVPDFVICGANGFVWFVECKAKGGKLSVEQTVTKHVLLALGHQYHTVYSFEEFLSIVNSVK